MKISEGKMFQFRRGISALLLIVSTILILSPLSYAATPAAGSGDSGNGYRISPVRTDLVISAGSSKTVRVYIKNVSSGQENLKVLINDFRADSETGAPALYLGNETAPHTSLKQYIAPPTDTTILAPGEQKAIDIKINIPANAKPGGYFGAVRFAPSSSQGNDTVNLAASVASLILVSVPGNYKEQVAIASFAATQNGHSHGFFVSPKQLQAVARFKNSGDIQEQPFGKIILHKGSTVLGTYEINSTVPRGNILPDSIRRFTVDLNKVGSFGKYTLDGNFGYGNNGQLLTATTSFYVVPIALIIAAALVILLLIPFLIFGLPRMIRGYNARVVRKARG